VSEHPYRTLPDRAFWSRSVATGFSPADIYTGAPPLLATDRVVSAGSCFASNLVIWIEGAGLEYVRTERPHPRLAHLPENLGYRNFSAAYGNIYTPRQLVQLLSRALGTFTPAEDRWRVGDVVIDPFRPGLKYPARSEREFEVLTAQHLAATRRAFAEATVFVFTLGLTEAWRSRIDGAVYPGAPGTIAGEFDVDRHEFHNFTVAEVTADLIEFVTTLRTINPKVRILLTVSPVPLVATATGEHVLTASTYSKSVLRVAAREAAAQLSNVAYFPAYELVLGPQAPESYLEPDRRNVSSEGVAAVMEALLASSGLNAHRRAPASTRVSAATARTATTDEQLRLLALTLAAAECDEALAES
jgi:hypothetical protein